MVLNTRLSSLLLSPHSKLHVSSVLYNCPSSLFAETMFPDRSNFEYDYDTLRTTGMVLAVIMFVSGILIALSKKITNCVKSSPNSNSSGTQIPKTEVPPQTV
ncbi:FXYD domain containing ion transport regulator 7 isoform X2 [Pseudoliparis swirei]|nr:FXYD domain containing ion transport regulator 7 isoform X2 [Pseudoliparis swirei]